MTETEAAPNDVDAAVAALIGDPSMPPRVDPAPAAAPSRADELRVAGAAPLPPIARADAAHSTKAGGHGYAVKVRGFYFANNPEGKGKVKKPYELVVNVAQLEAAGSTIKNKLLLPALKRKFPDAVRHRTFHIVSATPLSPEMAPVDSLQYMSREALESFARSSRVPVDLKAFAAGDVGTTQLRQSLIDFRQNPKDFAAREAERTKARLADAELSALNPDLVVGADAE